MARCYVIPVDAFSGFETEDEAIEAATIAQSNDHRKRGFLICEQVATVEPARPVVTRARRLLAAPSTDGQAPATTEGA